MTSPKWDIYVCDNGESWRLWGKGHKSLLAAKRAYATSQCGAIRGHCGVRFSCSDGRTEETMICDLCGSASANASACPLCRKVVCITCAEKPYEFCCD